MMVRPACVLASFVLLAVATSGCLAGESQVFGPGDSGGTATGTNEVGNGLALSMQASPARGPFPLVVTFTLKAMGAPANASWSLDFGDGSPPHAGEGLPAELQHTYRKAGAFEVLLEVEDGLNGSRATLGIDALTPKVTASASTSTTSSSPTPQPTSSSSAPSPTTTSSTTTTSATTSTTTTSSQTNTTTSASNTTSSSTNSTSPPPTNTTTNTTTTAPPSSTTTTTPPPSDTNTTTAVPPPSNTTSQTQTTTAPPPDPTATDTQTTSATATTTEPQV